MILDKHGHRVRQGGRLEHEDGRQAVVEDIQHYKLDGEDTDMIVVRVDFPKKRFGLTVDDLRDSRCRWTVFRDGKSDYAQ